MFSYTFLVLKFRYCKEALDGERYFKRAVEAQLVDDVAVALAKAAIVGIVAASSTIAVPKLQTIGIAFAGVDHLGSVILQALPVGLGAVEYGMHTWEELMQVVHLNESHDDTSGV